MTYIRRRTSQDNTRTSKHIGFLLRPQKEPLYYVEAYREKQIYFSIPYNTLVHNPIDNAELCNIEY